MKSKDADEDPRGRCHRDDRGRGLEAFVAAAARELPRGPRVNAVSPGWVRETLAALGEPEGGIPAADVARSYVEAVETAGLPGRTLVP
ncbi:hypothetical protein ACIA2T_01605 [Amycolatopsis japonica]|uniref:hypothetical protein n=1 Tax=Amycolatopsis japonica TaxID=208439 RepID=UPI0037AA79E5